MASTQPPVDDGDVREENQYRTVDGDDHLDADDVYADESCDDLSARRSSAIRPLIRPGYWVSQGTQRVHQHR